MKGMALTLLNKVKSNPKSAKLICFAVLSVAVICVSLFASGVTLAYNVNYGGTFIGQINLRSDFDSAEIAAANKVESENAEKYISAPEFSRVLTLKNRIASLDDITNGILKNTPALAESALLKIDGEVVAAAKDAATIQTILDTKLSSYNVEKYECSSEFSEDVKIVSGFYPIDKYSSSEDIGSKIDNLSVKTTVKETTDIKLSYQTVTKRTSAYSVGYYAVTTRGSNGLKHKVDSVVYLNGVEVSRESLEDVVVTQPVNQVVTIGTAPAYGGGGGSLHFPLASYSFISSKYGEVSGRSKPHKGIDFAAPRGTPVYAADDGVVTFSGWNSGGYGYYVIIDHGNGMTTHYAHHSQNLVKKGEKVSKGQTIALVGTTGQSTGYHLHFEVRINGTCVNPANYISK